MSIHNSHVAVYLTQKVMSGIYSNRSINHGSFLKKLLMSSCFSQIVPFEICDMTDCFANVYTTHLLYNRACKKIPYDFKHQSARSGLVFFQSRCARFGFSEQGAFNTSINESSRQSETNRLCQLK